VRSTGRYQDLFARAQPFAREGGVEYTRAALELVRREKARRTLAGFTQYFWSHIEPRPLEWAQYLDVLCLHLEAVFYGVIRDICINIPPRHLKSSIASVMFPAWAWLHKPELRFLTGSYDGDLSLRDSVRTRRLIESPEYRALLGANAWEMTGDQNVKSRYENNRNGGRTAISVGGRLTGFGGDIRIVDDAHPIEDGTKPSNLAETTEWYAGTFSSRKNDLAKSATIVLGQRVGEGDLSEYVLSQGFEHLAMPAVWEGDYPFRIPTSLGYTDDRQAGETLSPRMTLEVIAAIKKLGARHWDTVWQQRPNARKGAIIQADRIQFYRDAPAVFDAVVLSGDLNFKGNPQQQVERVNDLSFVVFSIFGFDARGAWLLDEIRGQWDFEESVRMFLAFCKRWPQACPRYIEDKANGPALVSLVRSKIPWLELVDPKDWGSKVERLYACQEYIHSGALHVPHPDTCGWMGGEDGWLAEITRFPNRRHDDRVDTLTQALLKQAVLDSPADVLERLRALGMH
jgi:predicted phage terminase large subunit-like protein